MKGPLLRPSSALERAVASRRPMSLYLSRTIAARALAAVVIPAAVVVFTRGWVTGLLVLAVALGLSSIFVTRRVDLEPDEIALVPLLPFMRTQRLPFAELGRFEIRPALRPTVRAPVDASATFRLGGVFKRSEVSLRAAYDTAFGDGVLGAAELRDLLEDYRGAAAPAVHPDEALATPDDKLRPGEWLAVFGLTVAAIVGIALVVLVAR